MALPLFTEVNNRFSIYQTSGQPAPNSSFFMKQKERGGEVNSRY